MPGGQGAAWVVLGIAAIVVGLWLADRILLGMERRGWIYWRRTQGTSIRPGLARASLELQTLLEPEKRYVLVLKKEEKTQQDDAGGGLAPPDPATHPD